MLHPSSPTRKLFFTQQRMGSAELRTLELVSACHRTCVTCTTARILVAFWIEQLSASMDFSGAAWYPASHETSALLAGRSRRSKPSAGLALRFTQGFALLANCQRSFWSHDGLL